MTDITPSLSMSIKASVSMTQVDLDTFCKELTTSQFCPPHFRANYLDIKMVILYGAELGFSAFQAVQYIKIINGKPSLYADGFLAACKNCKDWEDMIETFDESTMTAKCEAKRKGHQPSVYTFSWNDALKAKLPSKNPTYHTYPKRMLQMRARGFALRDLYADTLCGFISSAEANDYPTPAYNNAPEIDITPPTPHAVLFNIMRKQDKVALIKEWLSEHNIKRFSELPIEFIDQQLEELSHV